MHSNIEDKESKIEFWEAVIDELHEKNIRKKVAGISFTNCHCTSFGGCECSGEFVPYDINAIEFRSVDGKKRWKKEIAKKNLKRNRYLNEKKRINYRFN